jgi:hypothetical protein
MTKQDFEVLELGADMSFFDLPMQAREVACECWRLVENLDRPISALVRELDSNINFRLAVGAMDLNHLPKETDAVVRYFQEIAK